MKNLEMPSWSFAQAPPSGPPTPTEVVVWVVHRITGRKKRDLCWFWEDGEGLMAWFWRFFMFFILREMLCFGCFWSFWVEDNLSSSGSGEITTENTSVFLRWSIESVMEEVGFRGLRFFKWIHFSIRDVWLKTIGLWDSFVLRPMVPRLILASRRVLDVDRLVAMVSKEFSMS